MGWGKRQIDLHAVRSAAEDYAAFEKIGLSEIEDARVLDVGCFDGVNTVMKFSPYANVLEVVGIDPEGEALAEARLRADNSRFRFVESSFEGFEEEGFDLVYFSHVLQHIEDPSAACEKAFRLLKPGGWIVVKTVDDSLKVSYPDPDNVMRRLFSFYEQYVLPNTAHTSHTDRYNGQKCPTMVRRAGFVDVSTSVFSADTAGKDLPERLALFDRCVYFRRNVPSCVDAAIADRIADLARKWKALFEQDDYFFMTQSLVVVARKPNALGRETDVAEESFSCEEIKPGLSVRPMVEADLGQVMAIEVEAFPAPWTPVAFAMDLRHNQAARYEVVLDEDSTIIGYVGWWLMGDRATIMRVATDRNLRRSGIGTLLIERACAQAADQGVKLMQLEVRSSNEPARLFYGKLRFDEAGIIPGYYANPEDDAVVMVRALV